MESDLPLPSFPKTEKERKIEILSQLVQLEQLGYTSRICPSLELPIEELEIELWALRSQKIAEEYKATLKDIDNTLKDIDNTLKLTENVLLEKSQEEHDPETKEMWKDVAAFARLFSMVVRHDLTKPSPPLSSK